MVREPGKDRGESATSGSVQSVDRALDILEVLARSTQWVGISEVSEATGQPVGTVHRLLGELLARGYAVRDSRTRRYTLGPAARALAQASVAMPDWNTLAAPYLREAVALSGETTNIAVLDRTRAVYVAQAQPTRMVRMFTELGNRVPLHSTGVGKILLAHQSDAVVSAILDAGLPSFTSETITDPTQLLRELEIVRQRGYAIDQEEQERGVGCVAVPIRDQWNTVIAALSVSGPTSRLDSVHVLALIPQLQRISAALTAALSAPPADHIASADHAANTTDAQADANLRDAETGETKRVLTKV